nr:MAG TPA: hypothetical protein [Caudoviricetes sp.]
MQFIFCFIMKETVHSLVQSLFLYYFCSILV